MTRPRPRSTSPVQWPRSTSTNSPTPASSRCASNARAANTDQGRATVKLYRPQRAELSASVPDRHYDLAGSLLATAIAESTRTGTPVGECLQVAAHAAGKQIGEEAHAAVDTMTRRDDRRAAVLEILARHGYEPEVGRRKEIALANCPFHRLAEAHRTLVCGMNLDFLAGLLAGLGPSEQLTARLDPAPGYCCVRIAAA